MRLRFGMCFSNIMSRVIFTRISANSGVRCRGWFGSDFTANHYNSSDSLYADPRSVFAKYGEMDKFDYCFGVSKAIVYLLTLHFLL